MRVTIQQVTAAMSQSTGIKPSGFHRTTGSVQELTQFTSWYLSYSLTHLLAPVQYSARLGEWTQRTCEVKNCETVNAETAITFKNVSCK